MARNLLTVQVLYIFLCQCWINEFPATVALNMTNTLREDKYACGNNTVVTFTCETLGTGVLVWSSEELIGRGGVQLPFAAGANNPGDRRNSGINDHTYAVLTVNEIVDGQTRLVSTLFANATLSIPSASVTCHNQAEDDPITTPFTVLDFPSVPRDVFGIHLEQINDTTVTDTNGTCFISSFWRSPDNSPNAGTMEYMVSMDGSISKAETLYLPGTEGVRIAYFARSDCRPINVSVGAMNVCGIGPMSNDIPLELISCENTTVCQSVLRLFNSAPILTSLNILIAAMALVATVILSQY